MAVTPKRLGQTALASTSETTLYTVPASTTTIVKQIIAANTSASTDATFAVSMVASGGTAGTANRVVAAQSVSAGDSLFVDLSQVLATGGFVSVKASAADAFTVTASGVEIT